MSTVVGVILGTIHVDVHLLLAIEVKLTQTVLMAPGVAVETLYHAPAFHAGPVLHLHLHHLLLCGYLQVSLHAVVGAALVPSGDDYLRGSDLEVVAFGLFGDELPVLGHGLVASLSEGQAYGSLALPHAEVFLQQGHGILVCLGISCQDVADGGGESLAAPFCLLGKR